jgi:ABC-2 type transport system ATP-binding protein
MIKASGLRKTYGERVAVDGVDLDLPPGKTFGLLGPNGAGKTTTIQMLVGTMAPDAGSIDVAGQGSPTRPSVRKQIGVAPQALAVYPELTASENLAFFGGLYGLTGAALAERVRWCLDFAGLADRAKDRVSDFSGGMQRRLNMACALVHDPKVILFDEPTVGVDPQSRNHIFDSIDKLKQQERTILYTTHYMEEAARLCDRVAIMDRGKILDFDTVDGLIERHGGPPVTKTVVERGDLEGVFLKLTGRKLRD